MDSTRRSQLAVGSLVVAATGLLAAAVVTRTETREVALPAGTRLSRAVRSMGLGRRRSLSER